VSYIPTPEIHGTPLTVAERVLCLLPQGFPIIHTSALKMFFGGQGAVPHTYNPSYLGGGYHENLGYKTVWKKVSNTPSQSIKKSNVMGHNYHPSCVEDHIPHNWPKT
jgi:hypothetical protein